MMIRSEMDQSGGSGPALDPSQTTCVEPHRGSLFVDGSVGGVVLAGVHQWGACPLDQTVPRPLLPIANQPLVAYPLGWLRRAGLEDICLCASSSTDCLRERLHGEMAPGMALHYYQDVMPRGPAGCIRDAWCDSPFGTLAVVDATVIPRLDFVKVHDAHVSTGATMTMVVEAKRPTGRIRRDAMTPVGIYLFDKRALEYVPAEGYQDIKEKLIPLLYENGERLNTYVSDQPIPRVTGTDSYLAANDWAVETLLADPCAMEDYKQIGEALVHSSVTVGSDARVHGPVLIGPGGRIGSGVTLVGPTSIGSDCQVGDGAVVCRSSIWNKCTVGAGAVLDRCVLVHGGSVEPKETVRYTVRTQNRRGATLLGSLRSLIVGPRNGNGRLAAGLPD